MTMILQIISFPWASYNWSCVIILLQDGYFLWLWPN